MSTSHISFSTDILRRLGEELNPSPDQGILELVKNAYDADARSCTIELLNTDQPNGSVSVSDDGDGMTAEDIERGWLVIGRSSKSPTAKTRLNRVQAGSKGLGRLAALRLGTSAVLVTRPRSELGCEYQLHIDWSAYDHADLVESVPLEIKEAVLTNGQHHGTDIRLEGLRARITRLDAKKLARSLVLLADPFEDTESGFKPTLSAPEFVDLEKLVQNRYFTEADYHLIAVLDAAGRASVSVVDWKGEELFRGAHDDVTKRRQGASYESPPARFDLWAFLLNKESFETRTSTLGEVRTWLAQFGGVHVYHNGLRVAPYGNAGNDWLEMNLRRAKSPEERPSTNNSIGRISVEDVTGALLQKTDRSGFIEDRAFDELRAFAEDSLDWMARQRMEAAETRRTAERTGTTSRSEKAKDDLQKAIQAVPKNVRASLEGAFSNYDRSREREVNALKREVQLYRTLSTAGITAAIFAHESAGNPIKVITNSIKTIERRAAEALGKKYSELLKKPVDSVAKAIASLSVLGTATLRLLQHEKRRVARVDLHAVIDNTIATLSPFLEARQIVVSRVFHGGSPYLRGTEAAVESVIANLLNNSIVALEASRKQRREIAITTNVQGKTAQITIEDNGPGIEGIAIKDIWLPGETTKPNGTGLGLTIVRDATRDLGGTVEAVEHGTLGGAQFTVSLPILGH